MHKILSNILLTAALTATVLCLGACGNRSAKSADNYIGIDAAKEAALTAANLSSDKVPYLSASLDSKDNTYYYQVSFTENDVEHKYEIDALTGTIIGESHAPAPQTQTSAETLAVSETPADTTKQTDSPTSSASVQPATVQPPAQTTTQTASGEIDSTAALAAALAHAGVSEQNLAAKKVEADYDNGRKIFEVEFITTDGVEYDYDISAADGSVISFDYDAESLLPPAPAPGSTTISDEQAKQAVLARVPGASAEAVRLHLEEDDGRLEYEGSLIYDSTEYEFKIDAYSGSVIEWEEEPVHSRH